MTRAGGGSKDVPLLLPASVCNIIAAADCTTGNTRHTLLIALDKEVSYVTESGPHGGGITRHPVIAMAADQSKSVGAECRRYGSSGQVAAHRAQRLDLPAPRRLARRDRLPARLAAGPRDRRRPARLQNILAARHRTRLVLLPQCGPRDAPEENRRRIPARDPRHRARRLRTGRPHR